MVSVEQVYPCPGCEYCVAGFEIAGEFQDPFAGVTHDTGGVRQSRHLSVLCLARDSRPARQRAWNHLTAASASAASSSQALLPSKLVNGNLLPPASLTRSIVLSTWAWALMCRSHTAELSMLSVQCPQ